MGQVTYKTATNADYAYGPSPSLWGDLNEERLRGNVFGYAVEIADDFSNYNDSATTVPNGSGTPVFAGDCTVTGAAVAGGGLELFGTTDTEEALFQAGGPTNAPFVISDTAANAKKLWFEAAIKKSTIADTKGGVFVGLAGENAGVAGFLAETDFADVDLIGFWSPEADGDTVYFVYQITGKGFVTKITDVATFVANTFLRLGFKYDPDEVAAKKIKVFVDGVEQTTYVTATNIATDTFPDGEEMSPIAAIEMASGDDLTVTLDWWRCVQLR